VVEQDPLDPGPDALPEGNSTNRMRPKEFDVPPPSDSYSDFPSPGAISHPVAYIHVRILLALRGTSPSPI
jgi:hypothetical protein